ncbi:hypothetical protein HHK36_017139 [Tetracentron sinense]|uniref:Protein kinase domain-containing protein n=1 Tax=Tetracentron sinense TaxID=13715 RepID=A0A834Z4N3_TETSI|nr:hypothetical protein HHK36_017139 [Tetracentron sinense]
MGLYHGKHIENSQTQVANPVIQCNSDSTANSETIKASKFPFYSPSPVPSAFKNSPANSSVSSTPLRIFKRLFPLPSLAKHIKALLARRHGSVKPNEASIPEGNEDEVGLDKNFGFSKQLLAKYELGEEMGRGHFGYTCSAKAKKGELKGQDVAVKIVASLTLDVLLVYGMDCNVFLSMALERLFFSAKLNRYGYEFEDPTRMATAIAIEDVRREVKILHGLTGHKNLVQFYDAFEDDDNVYIVMDFGIFGIP